MKPSIFKTSPLLKYFKSAVSGSAVVAGATKSVPIGFKVQSPSLGSLGYAETRADNKLTVLRTAAYPLSLQMHLFASISFKFI